MRLNLGSGSTTEITETVITVFNRSVNQYCMKDNICQEEDVPLHNRVYILLSSPVVIRYVNHEYRQFDMHMTMSYHRIVLEIYKHGKDICQKQKVYHESTVNAIKHFVLSLCFWFSFHKSSHLM